jgi:uncharacterized RDD family membrane protein YckC
MTTWYREGEDGRPVGPVEVAELVALHRAGALAADTRVWCEGMSEWRPWGEVAGQVLAEATPVQTPDIPRNGPPALPEAMPVVSGGGWASAPSPASPAPAAPVYGPDRPFPGGPVVYAGFWNRLAAAILDGLLLSCVGCFLVGPLWFLFGVGGGVLESLDDNPFASAVSLGWSLSNGMVSLMPDALYHGWLGTSALQGSLGKYAVGIKVVRSDGSRVSFWRGFLRHLAHAGFAVATCGLGLIINAVVVAATPRKQGLHDMVCDTLVVDRHAFTPEHGRQQTMIGTTSLVVLIGFALLATLAAVMLGASIGALVENLH